MSILKIIAIVIVIGSLVTFVIQYVKGKPRSSWLFAATAVLSIVLFVMADKVETMKQSAEKAPLQVADGEAPSQVADSEASELKEEAPSADNQFDFADNDDDAPAEAAAVAEAPAEAAAAAVAEAPAEVVENDPLAPKAVAGEPVDDAKIKEAIVFDASQSKKNKASIKKYHWDFGDGATADTAKATHGYAAVGSYIATLTIEDADGHKAIDTRKIDVTRPEAKMRYTQSVKKVADVVSSTSAPADLTGTATKIYPASNITLEAKGTLESAEGCTCSLTVVLTGAGCNGMQTKKVSDGGEGSLSVKTTCRSEAGEYTWAVKRTSSGSCACSWTDIKIDGYEN